MLHLSPDRLAKLEALLSQVLDLVPEQRSSFLERVCADTPALRNEIQALLALDDGALLKSTTPTYVATLLEKLLAGQRAETALLPQRVDVYELVRLLGRGGMGAVYLARRTDGRFEHEVAIKLVRPGLLDPAIQQRFLVEQQILARLQHEHIARLYDGGTTRDGQPYFVMEYVEGEPITTYSDVHQLTVHERLRLFGQVCQAVQYAHGMLVVHRDFKPSNILVTREGRVKLLDFGIAKLLSEGADQEAGLTQEGHRVMTPEYAAPEQIKAEAVSTATDVYALGIIFYELLTGKRPYQLGSHNPFELERVICHEVPEAPSEAVKGQPEEVSRGRSVSKERLRRYLKGDLDTICLTALRKEPARRYASVEALREDVRRHLAGLPVQARRDTMRYRMGKFAKRHWMGLSSIVLGVVLVLFYTGRLIQERERAQTEAEKLRVVQDYLTGLFEVSDPDNVEPNDITALALLERGKETIEVIKGKPNVQAHLLQVLGKVYRQLGRYEEAGPLLHQSLQIRREHFGEEHVDVAQSLNELGWVLYGQGDYDQAENVYKDALSIRRKLLGRNHLDVAESLYNLSMVVFYKGFYDEAEALVREAITIYSSHPDEKQQDIIDLRSLLGSILRFKGNYEEALPLLREALVMRRASLGPEHPHVAIDLGNLAALLTDMARYEEAIQRYREAVVMQSKFLGDDHPRIASGLLHLATALDQNGDYKEAEHHYREALAMQRRLFGDEHPEIARTMIFLGSVLRKVARYDEAEPPLREALEMRRKLLGEDHPDVANALNSLALVLRRKKDYDGAVTLYQEALGIIRARLGDEHRSIAMFKNNLASTLQAKGAYPQAEQLHREALDLHRKIFGPEHPSVARSLDNIASTLLAQGMFDEAEPLSREALSILRKALPKDHYLIARAGHGLAEVYMHLQRYEEAEPLLREALEIRLKVYGDDDDLTADAKHTLGRCYTALGRYSAAEPLLLESLAVYEKQQAQEQTRQARQALYDLYIAWAKPNKAAPYQG